MCVYIYAEMVLDLVGFQPEADLIITKVKEIKLCPETCYTKLAQLTWIAARSAHDLFNF